MHVVRKRFDLNKIYKTVSFDVFFLTPFILRAWIFKTVVHKFHRNMKKLFFSFLKLLLRIFYILIRENFLILIQWILFCIVMTRISIIFFLNLNILSFGILRKFHGKLEYQQRIFLQVLFNHFTIFIQFYLL